MLRRNNSGNEILTSTFRKWLFLDDKLSSIKILIESSAENLGLRINYISNLEKIISWYPGFMIWNEFGFQSRFSSDYQAGYDN